MHIRTCPGVVIASILFAHAAVAQPLIAKIGEFKVSAIPLADAIVLLQDECSQNIYVNWKAMEAKGIDRSTAVTVELRDGTLEQAMAAICASLDKDRKLGLAFADDDGVAYLSTVEDLEKRAKIEPLPARGDEELAKTTNRDLDRPMPEMNFNQISVSDAIEFIKKVTQMSIEVNWDALEKAGIKKQSPTTFRTHNLTLRRTLRMLLDDVGGGGRQVDYIVDGDHILISTREDLEKK